jgi:hypothetical protein
MTTYVPFINEILSGTKSRDIMSDYYPDKLWVDTDTGTFGDCSKMVVIDTIHWTVDDCDEWEDMTDRERAQYCHQYGDNQNVGPAEWLAQQ